MGVDENISVVQYFTQVESCVDYQSFVYSLDKQFTPQRYEVCGRLLLSLGTVTEERMGVVYVRGPWGFFVVPAYGYPTLKISFFHDSTSKEIEHVLLKIYNIFNQNKEND